jgi:hypothetical protein
MSHRTGAGYRVESAEERARRLRREEEARRAEEERQRKRRLAEAQTRCGRMKSRILTLYVNAGRTNAVEATIARVSVAKTLPEFESLETWLKTQIGVAEGVLKDIRDAEAKKPMAKATGKSSFDFGLEIDVTHDPSKLTPGGEKIRASLQKLRGMIDLFEDETKQEELLKQIEKIETSGGTNEAKAKEDLLLLQTTVDKEQKRHRERSEVQRKAQELLLDIAYLENADVLKERLQTASTREQLKYLTSECKRMIEENTKREDAEFVARAIMEAFEDLGAGYASSKVDTVVNGAKRELYFTSGEMKHNAIKVSIDGGRDLLESQVVALDEEGVEHAAEQAASVCGDIFSVYDALGKRGVRCTLKYQKKADEVTPRRVELPGRTQSPGRGKTKSDRKQHGTQNA